MEMTIFAAFGFLFAAYAVVGNDALQTLGTFINSNSKLHWFWLFLFAGTILVATFTYGWVVYEGDPSWGRLSNAQKYPWPEGGIQWYHTLPPLALVIITRFGIPVSTSFMVLTVFATVGGMTSMLQKSLTGYLLAFVVGLALYLILSRTLEKYFKENDPITRAPWGLASVMGIIIAIGVYFLPDMVINCDPAALTDAKEIKSCNKGLGVIEKYKAYAPFIALSGFIIEGLIFAITRKFGQTAYWVILQWVTTGYLWAVWLIQDFANIFVFLPRQISALESFVAMFAILLLLAYTFWNKGGPVQRILKAKTAVTDIRSATLIDFTYACLLFFFKEVSAIPMSTTFVFLGLMAGREYGFTLLDRGMDLMRTTRLTVSDAAKAFIGLVVSIDMAVGLPRLAEALSGKESAALSPSYQSFILIANLLLIPVAFFLMKQDSKIRTAITGALLLGAGIAFFVMPPG
jgi:hypothetical protein